MWDDLNQRLDELRDRGRYRELRPRSIDGVYTMEAGGRRLVNFGSNDYLGMASFIASKLPATTSVGSKASGLVCGWTDRHQRLADQLAAFEQTESAILFPTGFAACSGTVATLARSGDAILSDELNHASLIDGCRLSKAERVIFPHRDVDWIDSYLTEHRSRYARVWILSDTVFSMDGHLAPLNDLCRISEKHAADLILDEAHATGVLGASGSGACEALGVKDRAPIRIGTLSKALGGQGGFVACPTAVANYLVNHCRSLIFSTSLCMPAVEAAMVALEHADEMRARGERVRALSQRLRSGLSIECKPVESEIPIVPIPIGADADALAASQRLQRLGMFVPAIRPPTVAEGQARLRVSLSADHHPEMIDRLIDALKGI